MDHDANQPTNTADDAADLAVVTADPDESAVDELLIEEISIDGMCGVY